jgi:TnpA family transposase
VGCFARSNLRNRPTALDEIGPAVKTRLLCRYLDSEGVRGKINDGLNVVENWNSPTDLSTTARAGEIASNRHDEQAAALPLHLLQASLVYVTTLMLQEIRAEPGRFARMTPGDLRALSPLIYHHINPYGIFKLDKRLDLTPTRADHPGHGLAVY